MVLNCNANGKTRSHQTLYSGPLVTTSHLYFLKFPQARDFFSFSYIVDFFVQNWP